MKEDEAPTTTTTTRALLPSPSMVKRESSDSGALLGKMGYKFWVLAAILVLAIWSMFTGSVTLKWSSITRFSGGPKFPLHADVDILEVEEREKMVRNMWQVYSHSATARLPHFWTEAFQAAYHHLVSDVPSVQNAAVSEIAKMSLLDPLSLKSGAPGMEGKAAAGKWRKALR